MNEDFLAALEDSLGLQHIKLSLDDLWSRTAPTHVRGTAMYDFVRGVSKSSKVLDSTVEVLRLAIGGTNAEWRTIGHFRS